MNNIVKGKLSSHEETRSQFNGSQAMIKPGIDPAADGPGLLRGGQTAEREQSQAATALDGVGVIKEIRGNDEKARIIVLTTFDGDEDIYRAI
jgi:hypothetical protein